MDANAGDLSPGPTIEEDEANALAARRSVRLRVKGVSKAGPKYVYRMETRDGQYVGATLPTMHRAVKGDVLVLQPNLLALNEYGDFQWTNPHVDGGALGRAHDTKGLQKLAEEWFRKDDGIPDASGDQGAVSGPTSGSSHVNTPLPNISVFYGKKRRTLAVMKADQMQQIVYGVVLEPDTVDSQKDYVPAADVELTAHNYLANAILGNNTVHKIGHRLTSGVRSGSPRLVPVESFIAPVDFTYDGVEWVKKGSWVLAAKVLDKKLWQGILDGEFTGWSVGGTGQRRQLS